eukprot:COSAG01_NODE_105_length_26080_cov_7.640237_17_plen_31_part_01
MGHSDPKYGQKYTGLSGPLTQSLILIKRASS